MIAHAREDCSYCHGSGQTFDWVPYGSTNVQMPTDCDCWLEGFEGDPEDVDEIRPAPGYYPGTEY